MLSVTNKPIMLSVTNKLNMHYKHKCHYAECRGALFVFYVYGPVQLNADDYCLKPQAVKVILRRATTLCCTNKTNKFVKLLINWTGLQLLH
jgi:hypothetical protein